VPRLLPAERWALTPPFHPYRVRLPSTGRLRGPSSRPAKGFPSVGHRGALHRRFIFCGTVRSRNPAARLRELDDETAPWRYQARCPLVPHAFCQGLSSKASGAEDHGVRTFLPAGLLTKDGPAITRLARQFPLYLDTFIEMRRNGKAGDNFKRRVRDPGLPSVLPVHLGFERASSGKEDTPGPPKFLLAVWLFQKSKVRSRKSGRYKRCARWRRE
jgi:hypothetical protein